MPLVEAFFKPVLSQKFFGPSGPNDDATLTDRNADATVNRPLYYQKTIDINHSKIIVSSSSHINCKFTSTFLFHFYGLSDNITILIWRIISVIIQ